MTVNPLAGEGAAFPLIRAQRLVNLLLSAFRLGNRAVLALTKATEEYVEICEAVPDVKGLLNYIRGKLLTPGLEAALEPLECLVGIFPSGPDMVNVDLQNPGILVLDFEQVESDQMRRLMVELLLRVLWDKKRVTTDACPLVFLLDEAQNLSWREESMSVRVLQEGRKFEIAGWFATQYMSNETAQRALRQAATHLWFRQDRRAARKLASELAEMTGKNRERFLEAISGLRQGDFLMQMEDGTVRRGHVTAMVEE